MAEYAFDVETHQVTRIVVEADTAEQAEQLVEGISEIEIEELIAGATTAHDRYVCSAESLYFNRAHNVPTFADQEEADD